MSILIKGMDMPKSCGGCEFNYNLEGGSYEWWECVILHDDINQFDTRRTDCPLIEIPTPHGRLIDGEKLCYEFIDWQYAEAPDHLNTKEGRMVTDHERQYEIYLALGEAVIEIANAPTILEAEP